MFGSIICVVRSEISTSYILPRVGHTAAYGPLRKSHCIDMVIMREYVTVAVCPDVDARTCVESP